MNNSESALKQEMMADEMEDLMEYQLRDGLGFCLKFPPALRMMDNALTTLEKLRALFKSLGMRSERGLTGTGAT